MITTSRRTLVSGAAWAVPVIAVGAAAPAMAASPPVIITQVAGEGCKEPGGSEHDGTKFGYRFVMEATSAVADVLAATGCELPKAGAVTVEHAGEALGAGVPARFIVKAYSEKSANGTGTMTFVFAGVAIVVAVSADDFPPCDD